MKFSKIALAALLSFASFNGFVNAQDGAEATGTTAEAATTTTDVATTTDATNVLGDEASEAIEDALVEAGVTLEEVVTIEPEGATTEVWMQIFDQGTTSWNGFDIRRAFTGAQLEAAAKSRNSTEEAKNYQKPAPINNAINTIVGRVDGQTAWAGVNQDGAKTMSYQLAIIVHTKGGETGKLKDIFTENSQPNQATQFGWWIPMRGEAQPPENWLMNLANVDLKSPVNTSTITVTTTIWTKGLYEVTGTVSSYDKDLEAEDPENPKIFSEQHISEWTFDAEGLIDTVTPTEKSKVPAEAYFVPIKGKTQISEDRLVFALEGSSLKELLPAIRGNSTVPFRFQILDYNVETDSRVLQAKHDIALKWTDDFNRCTIPSACLVEEKDAASTLFTTFTSTIFASAMLVQLFSF